MITRDIAIINAIFQIWPLWIVCGFCLYKAARVIWEAKK